MWTFSGIWTLSCSTRDLIPWPGTESRPPSLQVQSRWYWTIRDVSLTFKNTILIEKKMCGHHGSSFTFFWSLDLIDSNCISPVTRDHPSYFPPLRNKSTTLAGWSPNSPAKMPPRRKMSWPSDVNLARCVHNTSSCSTRPLLRHEHPWCPETGSLKDLTGGFVLFHFALKRCDSLVWKAEDIKFELQNLKKGNYFEWQS